MMMRIWGAALLAAVSAASPAQTPPAPPPAESVDVPHAERMADLLRFWTMVRLFHVDPRSFGPDWEAALARASDDALAAPDDATVQRVAQTILTAFDPTELSAPATPTAPVSRAPVRIVDGVAVISCPVIGAAVGRDPGAAAALVAPHQAAIAAQGMILDCRGFQPGEMARYYERSGFGNFLRPLIRGALAAPAPLGASRMRFHDGYPPDDGSTSGGYVRGMTSIDLGTLAPAPGGPRVRMAMIIDGSTPDAWTTAAWVRAIGGAVIVAGDAGSDGRYVATLKHLTLGFRASDYVAPDGRIGFPGDACVASDAGDRAVTAARAMLLGGTRPGCAAAAAIVRTPSAIEAVPDGALPSLGMRMVALARLWGTIRYFHPYVALNDRSWDDALAEFVPIFAAAKTRSAYESAVMRLLAHSDDSHNWMTGGTANPIVGSYSVPLYRRWLHGELVVATLFDPAIADRIAPGDVITAIDGVPAAQAMHRFDDVMPAATPQSRADLAARLALIGPKDSVARLTIRRGAATREVLLARSALSRATGFPPPATGATYRTIAPGIGYIDMTRLALDDADAALDALIASKTLIIDLRGYPNGTAWALAPRLALAGHERAVEASFRRPHYIGPGDPQSEFTQFEQRLPDADGKTRFTGKLIVLIDERAISQSEHSMLMFAAAARPIFIGTATAGTNGDVTNVTLPGGLRVSFSGHDVRHADGRQLQRVGIKPDIVVEPTAAGIRAGRDEVLERALVEARKR